ncbi:type II toxin-antitoxin system PemK/MazF family toxin [Salinicoccus sp. ID82-1]|uniref:type II toxin-antitoxin system PemK/MazF family toxin n=1 Tax=Salinicoccus sp. ID82-1 TaxID=2820269 RepID=UPI001F187159|nr:type II toxin-antitoxin system PemK/MazF family toxin [Salinicoccus sp. ID82-1]MCG1010914.1 type II toxin-antitoxin system PemK/MazF family toxin [Salinicoccus sp. ID82-1]
MNMAKYFKAGDIIKINMSPAKGHEQQGYRPVIVVSEENVHKQTDLIWVLPITNTDKGYPTHVAVDGRTKNSKTTGYVLCEKIKAIDPAARSARLTDEAERELLEDCKRIIEAITYIGP